MSFINISKKTDTFEGKKKSQIICPYCRDTTVKLRWHGRNTQGRAEYWDLTTDSLHICKYKAGVECKFCGKDQLQWVKSTDTKSGVELKDKYGKLHNCQNRRISDYLSQIEHFFDKIVILESDPEETKRAKMKLQDKLRGRFKYETTPEEIENYEKFIKKATSYTI